MNGATLGAGQSPFSAFRTAATARLTAERRRALRDGLVVAGLVALLAVGWLSYHGPAIDARAYWANRPPLTYEMLPGSDGAFLYSPAFAHLLSPLTTLPWEVFLACWLALLLLAAAWLSGPLLLVPVLVLVSGDILYGNIHFLLGAAIVLGFRHPWAWSLVLLTKITPGIGLLWFVRRREWRQLLIALAATAVIAGVSLLLEPQAWPAWLGLLERSASAPAQGLSALTPLWLRLPAAAAICWWGAGRDARWAVPVAATLALPVIWPMSMAMLVAVLPLVRPPWLRPGWRSLRHSGRA